MPSLFKSKAGKAQPDSPVLAKPARVVKVKTKPESPLVREIVDRHGTVLYDLCETILASPDNARIAFRSVLKKLLVESASGAYQEFQRAWVYRTACTTLRTFSGRHGWEISSAEQIELDASAQVDRRLARFEVYFHRLSIDDQLLLALKDRCELSWDDVATALGSPADSLKVRRQQALRALEEWLWKSA